MGRVFIDGFESGNTGLWDTVANITVGAAQTGMDGAYSALIPNTGVLTKAISAVSEIYVAFRYRATTNGTRFYVAFRSSGVAVCGLRGNALSDGTLDVVRGGESGGTILATTATPLSLATTYKIEIHYKAHDTAGIFQMKVDGLTVINFAGDTTNGPTSFDSIRFGAENTVYAGTWYIDNVVVDDTEWPGDTRIAAVKPSGAGNSAQWTPSTGSNWDCVDEVPPSDTDYLTTNTTGNKDTYAATDLPADASTVKCVQFSARIQKEGAPTPTKLAFVIRTGAVDYEGSGKELPTTMTKHTTDLWVNNPATSNPFTPSEVNGMEIGIKAVA